MPQAQLPIFPLGTTEINSKLAFEKRGGQIVYFNGHLPVFTHDESDLSSFRLITTQLIANGTASQREIAGAFGVSSTTVKRCCKAFKERGAKAFFVPPTKRQGTRLNPERLMEAQALLDQGQSVPKISAQLGVLATTIHKAIDDGRLRQEKKRPSRSLKPGSQRHRRKVSAA